MDNTSRINDQETAMQVILDKYLTMRDGGAASSVSHLDDDTIAAFVDGSLSEGEGDSAVGHLVECSFCRHVTAELVRLDLDFVDVAPATVLNQDPAPSSVSSVISGLIARIFGTDTGAVFAHTEEGGENQESDSTDENSK